VGDKALICLGSNKSNPVVEVLLRHPLAVNRLNRKPDSPRGEAELPILSATATTIRSFRHALGGVKLARSQALQAGIY